jgi:hypothetical protein
MARSPRGVARRIAEPYEGDAERPLQLGYDAAKQALQKLS